MENTNLTIALLIDSDNFSTKYFKILFDELDVFGKITFKRSYGDFTRTDKQSMRGTLLDFGITPMQQYSYTSGKNATDSFMIIDAMDILYKKNTNCVCLAASDSDFTRLAARFKEEGYFVIGAGEQHKTPEPFKVACDRFILVDVLFNKNNNSTKDEPTKAVEPIETLIPIKAVEPIETVEPIKTIEPIKIEEIIETVKSIIEQYADEKGYALFSTVMEKLYKKHNEFLPKNYGVNKQPFVFFKQLSGSPFECTHKSKTAPIIRINPVKKS